MEQPGKNGGLMAEIAREGQHLEARFRRMHGGELREGVVARAVVDEDDFPSHAHGAEAFFQAIPQQGQHFPLIVAGNDETQFGRWNGVHRAGYWYR